MPQRIPARTHWTRVHSSQDCRTRSHRAGWLRAEKVAAARTPDGAKDGGHAGVEAEAEVRTHGADGVRSSHHTHRAAAALAGAEEDSSHSHSAERDQVPDQQVDDDAEAEEEEQSNGAAAADAHMDRTTSARAGPEEAMIGWGQEQIRARAPKQADCRKRREGAGDGGYADVEEEAGLNSDA